MTSLPRYHSLHDIVGASFSKLSKLFTCRRRYAALTEQNKMTAGVVKFSREKGYGFITEKDGVRG